MGKIASFQTFSWLNLGKPSAFGATAAQTWGNSGRTRQDRVKGEEQKLEKGGEEKGNFVWIKVYQTGDSGSQLLSDVCSASSL